jgi:uncharacterized OsmC-like protein
MSAIMEETKTEAAAGRVVNGVNVSQLLETVTAVRGTPEMAKFRFRARNRWLGGGRNRTTIGDFDGALQTHRRAHPFVIEEDEPPLLLGDDAGANPVEYVLAALAGCLTTSLVYHAAAQGIEIEEVESEYEGDLDLRGFLGMKDDVRNGYESLRVTFRVKADAPEGKIRELVEMAQRRSPVFDIITNPVPIEVQLKK